MLQPHDFHPHWWIDRFAAPIPPSLQALDPQTNAQRRAKAAQSRRGFSFHSRGRGPRGTRRISSSFERSEAEQLPRNALPSMSSQVERAHSSFRFPPIRFNPYTYTHILN